MLCTESPELQAQAEGWSFPVLITAETCSIGSDRMASVSHLITALARGDVDPVVVEKAMINVQGDQPFIDPASTDSMVEEFGRQDPVPAGLTPSTGSSPIQSVSPML